MGESTRTVEFRNETRIASLCLAGRRLHLTTTERCPLPWELGRTRLPRVVATHATMAVRAGRPSSGSGGLEAYAIPIFGFILMAWLVRRLGPLLAARISRLLVGEETPLDFSNKGKLKGKIKRITKATPASAPLRSPSKRPNGSPTGGAAFTAAQEVAHATEPSKATGPASKQDSSLAPLAAMHDDEAAAIASARNQSLEWTVHAGKKPLGLSEGTSAAGSRHRPRFRAPARRRVWLLAG